MDRFIVELENNHHYIVIDTLTGASYFTPAQNDANSLATLLNNSLTLIENQRNKIKNYEELLIKNNLIYVNDKPSCNNCKFHSVTYLNYLEDIYCDKDDETYNKHHYCEKYVKE